MMYYISAVDPEKLKEKFKMQLDNGVYPKNVKVFVDSSTRYEWIMGEHDFTYNDKDYCVYFEDTGGRIWVAYIEPYTIRQLNG